MRSGEWRMSWVSEWPPAKRQDGNPTIHHCSWVKRKMLLCQRPFFITLVWLRAGSEFEWWLIKSARASDNDIQVTKHNSWCYFPVRSEEVTVRSGCDIAQWCEEIATTFGIGCSSSLLYWNPTYYNFHFLEMLRNVAQKWSQWCVVCDLSGPRSPRNNMTVEQ